MDVNLLRTAVTVLSFACFAGIVAWTWSRRHRAALDACGQIPFLDDDGDARP